MAQRSGTHRRPAATAVGGKRKSGLGRLKWLLALLLLAVIVVVLVLLLAGGDDERSASTSKATASAAPTAAATATPDGAAAGGAGSLTVGGEALTPGDGAAITAAVGTRAAGEALRVESVVRGGGFWVGTSKRDRTFVEYGSAVGTTEQQTYKAAVGDSVDFRGPVRPAPEDPATTLKLGPADAERLSADGAYVNATTVTKR